ncbi:DUF262 domain-containing protein [Sulfitobacter mediterraneus]|uniref:DUF262 domain-containing protein n=1 Tax=Sulfitobacter mediterraneus TaxID=83219 RepID=UPI002493798C|nr:DUF262 domain-containing protein [Sulfitobacter mediterraneus]
MTYSTSTIGAVLKDINQRYFLPAIQRPFVWTPSKIVTLFDSLLKGYPISAFMFWAIDEKTKREVKIYKFIESYREGTHNDAASPNGRNIVLVLDGQQRLTSLLIGLQGTFAEKERYARRSNPDAWAQKTLYIDVLKDPTGAEEDEELGITYGLAFHAVRPRNDHRHHWIKVGTILDCASQEQLQGLQGEVQASLHHGVTHYDREVAESILKRLHSAIWEDEAINFYTEKKQSVDRVLDIFVRANDGGVKLSKSDLLMSMIISKWSTDTPREDIAGFVDYINSGLGTQNAIKRDFVLKACLVLCDFDVKYNVSNFSTQTIAAIEETWPQIKVAVERTFRLLNSFGIAAENLTSLNAVLPIAYYFYKLPEYTLLGSTEAERQNAQAIQTWLVNSLLVGAFAGSSDRTISIARATIRDSLAKGRNFPITELFRALETGGRISQLDERAVEELLELEYGKPKTFLALSLLYPNVDWNSATFHVDHIIPQAAANRRVLMGMNVPEHRIREIVGASKKIGNLQLLPAGENLEKRDVPFDVWITGRDRHYRERHMIPERPDLWMPTMLPEFVYEREKLIRERLKNFSGRAADA